MAFQQSLGAILIPGADPGVDAGAIGLQVLRDLTRSLSLDAEHDGLQAQGHAGCLVGLGFLAQPFEPLQRARIAFGKDGSSHLLCRVTYTQSTESTPSE